MRAGSWLTSMVLMQRHESLRPPPLSRRSLITTEGFSSWDGWQWDCPHECKPALPSADW